VVVIVFSFALHPRKT